MLAVPQGPFKGGQVERRCHLVSRCTFFEFWVIPWDWLPLGVLLRATMRETRRFHPRSGAIGCLLVPQGPLKGGQVERRCHLVCRCTFFDFWVIPWDWLPLGVLLRATMREPRRSHPWPSAIGCLLVPQGPFKGGQVERRCHLVCRSTFFDFWVIPWDWLPLGVLLRATMREPRRFHPWPSAIGCLLVPQGPFQLLWL